MNLKTFKNPTLGSIELLQSVGTDQRIVDYARISFNKGEGEQITATDNFIHNLITLGHETPFEHCVMTFKVKCPIFVARQWMRHRISSYNELSLRYTALKDIEFYEYDFGSEDLNNEQKELHKKLVEVYNNRLNNNIKKEIARIDLPVSMLTTFVWTANLREIIHFLRLRCHKSAQYEIRQFALAIREYVKLCYPIVERNLGDL